MWAALLICKMYLYEQETSWHNLTSFSPFPYWNITKGWLTHILRISRKYKRTMCMFSRERGGVFVVALSAHVISMCEIIPNSPYWIIYTGTHYHSQVQDVYLNRRASYALFYHIPYRWKSKSKPNVYIYDSTHAAAQTIIVDQHWWVFQVSAQVHNVHAVPSMGLVIAAYCGRTLL